MRTLFIALGLFIISLPNLAQFPMGIKFRVTDDAKNILKGMTIKLYEGNMVVREIESSKPVVSFELETEAIYTIEVALNGFVTKRVSLHTDALPSDHQKDHYKFDIALERTSDYRHLNEAEDVLEYPSAIVSFDSISGVFDYNEIYLNSTQEAFSKLFEEKRDIKF